MSLLKPGTIVLAFLVFAVSLGCGNANRGEVAGEVTLDGTALEEGAITFIPDGGNQGPSTGGVIQKGRYKVLDGVVLGKNRVEIMASMKSGKKITMPSGKIVDEYVSAVPPKYNKKSELTVDVQPGANKFDFPIASK